MNVCRDFEGVLSGALVVVLGLASCSFAQSSTPRAVATGPQSTSTRATTTDVAVGPRVAALPTAAVKPTESRVVGVTFEAQGQQSIVVMKTTGAPPQVVVKKLKSPTGVLLYMPQTRLEGAPDTTQIVQDPTNIVSTIETTAVVEEGVAGVKVIVSMRTPAPFEVKQDDNAVRLIIVPQVANVAQASPLRTIPVMPQSATLPTPAMILPALSPMAPAVVTPPPSTTPRVTPSLPQATSAARSAVSTSKSAPAAASASPRGSGPITVTETPVYTGQKISLDFQDADINDILRLIAEVSGLNIIAGSDVQGKVTTRMVDVPWDQALDVILKINGMAQEREGNIIRVAPLERFNAERQERLRGAQMEVAAEPTVTRVMPINYAPAADLKTNLEKLLSNRGTIFIDARTNTMIITDTQKNLDDMLALVNTLDRPTPQVMIEGRIVESSRNFLRELGVQIGLAHSTTTDRTFPNSIDVRGGVTPPVPAVNTLVPPPPPGNFLVDLPAAVARGSGGALGFSLASVGGSILDVQLSALESSGRGKIISSPKISTLDNTEALIQSGLRIPYETTSAEGTKTEFVDASISLKVTPHVTPNDFIGMKIAATKNEADFGRTSRGGAPTITTREATTEMLVRDGDTVVIGGLYRRNITSTNDGVPFLSKVPLLGWLFQKSKENDSTDELLIFITPRIIRQQEEISGKRRGLSY